MSESTTPVKPPETKTLNKQGEGTKGLAQTLAIIFKAVNVSPRYIGPERQITAESQSTVAENEQAGRMAQAMAEASRALMPQITRLTETQLDEFSGMQAAGELVPFFAQIQDLPAESRSQVKQSLKQLFESSVGRWADLNFDDSQSKPDTATGTSYRDRVTLPFVGCLASSVEYADAKAQIQEILDHGTMDNATPIVKKTALAIIREGVEKGGMNIFHEGMLKKWVDDATRDPNELAAAEAARKEADARKAEALLRAIETRHQLVHSPGVTLGERRVKAVTGQTVQQNINAASEHVPVMKVTQMRK